MSDDPRIDGLRWVAYPGRTDAHLWLGTATACGRTQPGQPTVRDRRCARCLAYARGWLDRGDWQPGRWPSPVGGRLPVSREEQAANRAVLERALHRSG